MPAILVVLAVIALVLYILFGYLIPPGANITPVGRVLIALLVVVLILIFWCYDGLRAGSR